MIWSSVWKSVVDLLCPACCGLCGAFLPAGQRQVFCSDCLADMSPFAKSRCPRCGRAYESKMGANHLCGECRVKPPFFDRAAACGLYDGALARAVTSFKYGGRLQMTDPLSAFMADHLAPPFLPPECDLIVPVPLHIRRLRERGFNQALILAGRLFAPWKDKIHYDLLERARWTKPQVRMKAGERRLNVKGAFRVNHPHRVKGRIVMVVDDVYTTGSTLNECAKALKKAGARQVWVLTLARVP